jgi:hypothetical protein
VRHRTHAPGGGCQGRIGSPVQGAACVLQDELTERRGCWPDEGGIPADTADGPVGVTAMTGRHVIGDRRVLAVAARPRVHGDPLAPGEDLDGTPSETHLDLGAREAVRNAIKVPLDIDVIIDADTANAPFGDVPSRPLRTCYMLSAGPCASTYVVSISLTASVC